MYSGVSLEAGLVTQVEGGGGGGTPLQKGETFFDRERDHIKTWIYKKCSDF